MDTVEVERATDPGYGSGGARTYDRYGEGDPRGGQFAPKGTSSSGRSPLTEGRPYAVKPKGGGGSAPTAPRSSSKFKTLGMGEDNDPQAVAEMQQLLTALGLGNLTSGTYDKDTEAAVMEAQRRLGVKKPNGKASKALVNKMLAAYDLSPCVKRSEDATEGDDAVRAAGHDVTPGHDELHHYWTKGEGLAKWAESPKPWTTLVAHLTKHVGPEKAKVFASRWFHEVFGFYAGSDLNRVTHGKPPRGERVGPG